MAPRCWKKTRIKSGHRHIHKCDMTRSYVGHGSFVREAWLERMFEKTHSDVRHPNWYIHCRRKRRESGHRVFMCVTWLILMYGIPTDIYQLGWRWKRQESGHRVFTCVTWLILMYGIPTPLYTLVLRKARIKPGRIGSQTYSYLWHDSCWYMASEFLYIPWRWERRESSLGHASPHIADPPYCRQWKASASGMLW